MRRKNWKQVVASALSAGMVMSTMPQIPVMAAGEDAQATVYETTEQEAEDNAQESVDDALVDSEISEEQGETAEEATEVSEEVSEESSEEAASEEAESEETADEETESDETKESETTDEETREMESEEVAETATEEEDTPETAKEATDEAEEETDSESEEETEAEEETGAEIEEDADFVPLRFVKVDENGTPILQATNNPDDEPYDYHGWIIWYRENIEGDAEIVSYEEPNGANANVKIPAEIEGMKVVAILDYAFQNCGELNSITIPDTVSKIGNAAFQNCKSLRKVTLPSKLKSIGSSAFARCDSLTAITIPKTLTISYANGRYNGVFMECSNLNTVKFEEGIKSVPQGLFAGCTGLQNVTMPSGIKTIETAAFDGCVNLNKVGFPDTLVEVGDAAFAGCVKLANVNLPDTVVTIKNNAFKDCTAIMKLNLPKFTTYIGDNAFANCNNLTSLVLPAELQILGAGAFADCVKLPKVLIPKKLEATNCNNVYSSGPFARCKSLETVTFEDNTKVVANYLFCQCDGIKSISLNDTITEVKNGAFAVCTNLKSIKLSESIATIGDFAFYSCNEMENIKLPSHLKTIGGSAFELCARLQKISIPNQVTQIFNKAFYDCKKLTEAKLSSKLEHLGQGAFGNCVGLTSINIPKTLATCTGDANIGGPFMNCENLKTVTFTAGIPVIPTYLFAACTGLEKITIPNTVTDIQDGAFGSAINLKNITLSNSATRIGRACFYRCAKLKSLVLPNTLKELGEYVCSQCSNLTKVELSNQLPYVPNNAFEYCSSLETVTIPASVKELGRSAFLESGLTSMTLTDNVVTIGDLCFYKCEKLATMNLGKGMKSIRYRAFENCDSLKTIVLPDSLTELQESAFNDCDSLNSITFGTGLTYIPKTCFYRNPKLKKIYLPYTITTLQDGAFGQCTGITEMHMPKNLNTIGKDVLSYSEYMIIFGTKGSYAETYAKENKFTFQEEKISAKKLTLDRTELYIPVGAKYQFTATVSPNNISYDFVWKTKNSGVVEVDQSGNIVAKALGEATIQVFVGEAIAECEVHVVPGVEQVIFNTGSMEMRCGEKKQLFASVLPDTAYDKSLSWVTSDANVAKVDANGNVTAVSAGTCHITAIANDGSGRQTSCFVSVKGNLIEVNDATKMQSKHNYEAGCLDVWKYSVIGADSITLTFDTNTRIAAADFLIIKDRDGKEIGKYTKKELSGKSVTIKSDTVYISFDAVVGDQWGFKVTKATYKKLKVTDRFVDLDPNAWYISAVEYISDRKIMNGKGNKKFAPNATITRAEFVTVLWNLEENPSMQYSSIFSDVPGGQWYSQPVMWAYQSGVTRGYGATFGTNDNIQRQQLATMLYSYAKLKGYNTKYNKNSISTFMDYGNVATYAEEAMNWAVDNKIISGSKQNNGQYALKPEGQATRAECAQMVKQFLVNVAKAK